MALSKILNYIIFGATIYSIALVCNILFPFTQVGVVDSTLTINYWCFAALFALFMFASRYRLMFVRRKGRVKFKLRTLNGISVVFTAILVTIGCSILILKPIESRVEEGVLSQVESRQGGTTFKIVEENLNSSKMNSSVEVLYELDSFKRFEDMTSGLLFKIRVIKGRLEAQNREQRRVSSL